VQGADYGFSGIGVAEQLKSWEMRATDTRPAVGTGWPGIDSLLHRGGLMPGHLAVIAGRTHTRKTTVALNIVTNLLRADVPVGLVALDEPVASYVGKLASAMTHIPLENIEAAWDTPGTAGVRELYAETARRLSITRGYRPDFDDLSAWLDMAEFDCGERPRVVFVDYLSLLTRDKYAGQEVQRVSRLVEDLQVWTRREEVVTVALHHVGREAGGDGDEPLDLAALKYGGEEVADVVFTVFRPALSKLGNMARDHAEAKLGDKFDEGKWGDSVARVRRERDTTYIQLVKNRPGVHLDLQGQRFRSHGESQYLAPVSEYVSERAEWSVDRQGATLLTTQGDATRRH